MICLEERRASRFDQLSPSSSHLVPPASRQTEESKTACTNQNIRLPPILQRYCFPSEPNPTKSERASSLSSSPSLPSLPSSLRRSHPSQNSPDFLYSDHLSQYSFGSCFPSPIPAHECSVWPPMFTAAAPVDAVTATRTGAAEEEEGGNRRALMMCLRRRDLPVPREGRREGGGVSSRFEFV